jgi:predicted nuclease with TOPRIM domain
VVVAGAIFIITAQKQKSQLGGGPLTDKAYENFIATNDKNLTSMTQAITDMKSKTTKPTPEQTALFTSFDTKLAEFKSAIDGLKNITGEKERVAAMSNVRTLRRDLTKMEHELSGNAPTK